MGLSVLTVARGVAGPAQIPIHLDVPLRTPDGVARFIGPGAGAVLHVSRPFLLAVAPRTAPGQFTYPVSETEVQIWTSLAPPKLWS